MNIIFSSRVQPLFIFFLSLVVINLQSCASSKRGNKNDQAKYEWRKVKQNKKDQTNWVIYTRKLRNSNFLEYKIEGAINSSPSTCLRAFRQDLHHLAEGRNRKKYPTYNIVEEDDESLLTYVIHNEPFPFKNTEMSIRYFFSQDPNNKNYIVEWEEDWEAKSVPPKSKKLSRVQTFRGSWHFIPISPDQCNAINVVQFDLKKMPLWIAEPMVIKFLKKGLEDLRTNSADNISNYTLHDKK